MQAILPPPSAPGAVTTSESQERRQLLQAFSALVNSITTHIRPENLLAEGGRMVPPIQSLLLQALQEHDPQLQRSCLLQFSRLIETCAASFDPSPLLSILLPLLASPGLRMEDATTVTMVDESSRVLKLLVTLKGTELVQGILDFLASRVQLSPATLQELGHHLLSTPPTEFKPVFRAFVKSIHASR
eukprot:GILI01010445.1.p1 GENE.GILI01010445.1~~GILI01010445.1.p1  ORF type:complete len:213 (+),score=59.33 GILI01010445.1:81-641(+)